MNEVSVWIEHLRHPLVLAGFGLFVFALIIKPLFLNSTKISGTATERLLNKGMILLFTLAAMAVAGGIALNWKNDSAGGNERKAPAMATQPIPQQPVQKQQEVAADSGKGASLNITASGQGQVSIGGDVINANGNMEKNDAK